MQNQRSVLPSMLALPRSWNKAAPTTPLLRYIIAYAAHKVNIGTAAARCRNGCGPLRAFSQAESGGRIAAGAFQMQGADEAWCSAVLSVEAENIDNLPATF